VRIAKHRNGSLETIKLRALLHIQKFIEDDEFGNSGGMSGGGGGNWRPVPADDAASGGARLYVQAGSKMKDLPVEDDDTPF
jgi:replicative DNA helicase